MAEKRMFAKTIIDSDAFLDMPLSTQALYFHLSMRADDEGFINNPKKIQRMTGASEDDLKLLVAKNFVIPFESGIVVIKHWRIHNYIRADRLVATKYKEEREQLELKDNGAYTIRENVPAIDDRHLSVTCQADDGQVTDVCPSDVSIDKNRLDKNRLDKVKDILSGKPDFAGQRIEIIKYLNEKTGKEYRHSSKANARLIDARLNEGYTVDDFKHVIDVKTEEWKGTDMEAYLRPETLFGATKFEGYLNQKVVRRKAKNEFNNFAQHEYDMDELTKRAKRRT